MKLVRSVTLAIQSENMCVPTEMEYDKDKEADEQIIKDDEINDENYNEDEGDLRNRYNEENEEDGEDDKDDNMDENGNEENDDNEMDEKYEDMDNNANEEDDNENE